MTTNTPSDRPGGLACARARVLIEAYVDGELAASDPGLARQMKDHLAGCDDCRRQYRQAVSLPFRLKALRTPVPPDSILGNVMRSIRPTQTESRRAWTLLIPEAALVAFIVWYLSGLDGLATVASGAVTDLQVLLNWGVGAAQPPSIPVADVFLLAALIALAITAAYHLSILSRLDAGTRTAMPPGLRERRRA
jgi:predicted anti-sigma-YlaC factor YlaD